MKHSLWNRFVLFVRYDVSGVSAFLAELVLLYVFLNTLGWSLYMAVPVSFAITATIQWSICHLWVFSNSHRPARTEYAYFVSILLSGLVFATVFVALLVHFFAIDPIIARILSGTFTGLWGFYLNAHYNFRSKSF